MTDSTDDPIPVQFTGLARELDCLTGSGCAGCGHCLCGHLVLCNVALGLKDAPRCLDCLARGLHRSPGALLGELVNYIQRRECFRQAWDLASDREGLDRSPQPVCMPWDASADADLDPPQISPGAPAATAWWDAGDMSCGELVLALRIRLNALPPGTVLHVTAHATAAPDDLPAWCRLTGQRLGRAEHPDYHIQRKET